MSRFDRALTWIENGIAGVALGGAAIMAIVQVVLRYVFNTIIFWSEEAVIYLVILSTFVGAVIALRHNEHVGVNILAVFLGERGKRVLAALSGLLVALYCGVFGALGWVMITEPAARTVVTPAMKMPLWVVQLALPIGLTLMFLRALEMVYRVVRYGRGFPESEKEEHGEDAR
ncbi:MAG: TRAP transporter small permease subunit [Streptosporangiales bacterium]|nr:TRAP transporter small permease subunit [Streptosporangiales bacterium]